MLFMCFGALLLGGNLTFADDIYLKKKNVTTDGLNQKLNKLYVSGFYLHWKNDKEGEKAQEALLLLRHANRNKLQLQYEEWALESARSARVMGRREANESMLAVKPFHTLPQHLWP